MSVYEKQVNGSTVNFQEVDVQVGNTLYLKNGDDLGAIETSFEEDGEIKGSLAKGKYSVALNQNNKTFQRNSFVTGGGNKVGLTENEFNTKYNEGVDETGSTYPQSNTFSNAGGQENIVTGRGSHIGGGYKNNVTSNYSGIMSGGSNTVNGTYSGIMSGGSNTVNGDNSVVVDGYENTVNGNNSGTSGSGNTVDVNNGFASGRGLILNKTPNSFVCGQWNNPNSYALAQVGVGTSENARRNAVEVFQNGVVKVLTQLLIEGTLDLSNATIVGSLGAFYRQTIRVGWSTIQFDVTLYTAAPVDNPNEAWWVNLASSNQLVGVQITPRTTFNTSTGYAQITVCTVEITRTGEVNCVVYNHVNETYESQHLLPTALSFTNMGVIQIK